MKIGLRVWVLIIFLFFAFLAISPWKTFEKGVLITDVEVNSTAFEEGLREGQIITSIDGNEIKTAEDFTNALQNKYSSGEKRKLTITTDKLEVILFSNESPQIVVSDIPKTNIKTGLDLSGGARALIRAQDRELSASELDDLVAITSNRLNEFGLTDLSVQPVSDLSGNNFMLIEIAGATPNDLEEMVSKQGKFEAKISDEIVFIGGERDIASVARSGQDSGIFSCSESQGTHFCNFRFTVFLSEEAANRHAEITKNLSVNSTPEGNFLSEKLDLYLDDKLVDSLLIGESLKGRVTTQISISGSGTGATRDEAYLAAEEQMKKLQTILITGSLPFKLEIVKLDTISPSLGESFTKNIIFLGLIVFLIISIILFIKYRKIKITLSVILTMFSEMFITLGIAALISWNLDAPSIAGIIAGMGTGVNDQIVILDESISNKHLSLKERIKRALFIIVGAFFTIVAAMLPLFWAGAGMLRGFALTTIIGVTVGILITRPAFAEIVRKMGD